MCESCDVSCYSFFFFFFLPRLFLVLSRSLTHFPDLSFLRSPTSSAILPPTAQPARHHHGEPDISICPDLRSRLLAGDSKLGLFQCRPDLPSARGTRDGARRVSVGGLYDDVDLAAEGVTAEADASVGEALAVMFSVL